MSCTPAPACVAVRKQATKLWPDRSQASDGICASQQHSTANPNSDHEPHVVVNGVAYATAVDLTDDKARGCDADAWAEYLRLARDKRVKYVICNQRMFSSYPVRGIPAWTWRTYTGSNPHDKHTHLSITPEAVFDTAPWFPQLVSIDPITPHPEADVHEYRIVTIPPVNDRGTQIQGRDVNGNELGVFNNDVVVSLKANDSSAPVRCQVQPYGYGGKLVLSFFREDGKPVAQGNVGVVLSHPPR